MKYQKNIWLFLIIFFSACEKLELNWDLPKIPVVETLEPEDFCCLSVKVGCNLLYEGDSYATSGVCYSQFPNPTSNDNVVIFGEGLGFHTVYINNLLDNTKYYLRAFAYNNNGTGYGEEKQFSTGIGQYGTFIDARDGKIYNTVVIGSQTWMTDNLAYLPKVNSSSGGTSDESKYYVYGYKGTSVSEAKATSNYKLYGVLYNWKAANEACPSGWHLPSDDEWKQLAKYAGSTQGGKLLKATSGWSSGNSGTDHFGFKGLPGGYRDSHGTFYSIGKTGMWWSSSERSTSDFWYYSLMYQKILSNGDAHKEHGFSVRCLKD